MADAQTIIVDARTCFDGAPLALEEISGEIQLRRMLKIIRKAGRLREAIVVMPASLGEAQRSELERICADFGGCTTACDAPAEGAVRLDVAGVYVPHVLARLLRARSEDFAEAFIMTIASRGDLEKATDFYDRDRDLAVSRHTNMPLARALALKLKGTSVTPNQVTLASGVVGFLAAVLASRGNYACDVLAALALQAALTLDLSDGYLARLKNCSNPFGAWFDTILDQMLNVAMPLAIALGMVRSTGNQLWYLVGAIWLVSFHAIGYNFWITKCVGVADAPGEPAGKRPRRKGVVGALIAMARFAVNSTGGLDSKYYIMTFGLLLHVKGAMAVFMAVSNLLVLGRIITKRYDVFRRTAGAANPAS